MESVVKTWAGSCPDGKFVIKVLMFEGFHEFYSVTAALTLIAETCVSVH